MSNQKELFPVPSTSLAVSTTSEVELKIADSNSFPSHGHHGVIQRTHLRAIFDKFDDDDTGTLSLSQFSALCRCILQPASLNALDLDTIFNTIDVDGSHTIEFDEFIEFIQPSLNHAAGCRGDHRIKLAFASTVIKYAQDNNNNNNTDSKPNNNINVRKYSSPTTTTTTSTMTPTPKTFETEYESRFWSRGMGVDLVSGHHGINAYIKSRFTEHARTHISSGSQIVAINGKNMDGVCFTDVIHFLHIIIVTEEGFLVRFRPVCLLQDDEHRPSDVHLIHDNIADNELLKPKFDKKRQRRKTFRKLLTMSGRGGALPTTEPSMDYSTTMEYELTTDRNGAAAATTSVERELSMTMNASHSNLMMMDENDLESMLEQIDNCQPPHCWQRCPSLVRRLLCVHNIETMSQMKQYHTHCRHCPKKAQSCRSTMHMLLDNEKYNRCSYAIQVTIMLTIIISTLAYVLQTLPACRNDPVATAVFNGIEFTVSMIFTIEYVARIIAARNICVFFWDGLNLIDFIAIIPFWIELISGAQGSNALRVIRVIRLARVFRLMKSPRFAEYMEILQASIIASAGSFGLLLTLIFLEIIVASSLVYVCEADLDLEDNKFTSIPATSWWAFTTVTTVGYGDMVPQSAVGRIICVVTLFSGLLVIALPVIIIGGNFEHEYSRYLSRKKRWSAAHVFGVNDDNEQQIKTVARLLHFVNHSQCKDIFEWNDVRSLYDSGLDSFEIINRVLKLDHGYVYLPAAFSSYQKYALFHHYGRILRERNRAHYLHRLVPQRQAAAAAGASKSSMMYDRETQSQPPPTVQSLNVTATQSANALQQHKQQLPEKDEFVFTSQDSVAKNGATAVRRTDGDDDGNEDMRSVTAYDDNGEHGDGDDDDDDEKEQLIIRPPNKDHVHVYSNVDKKRNITRMALSLSSASRSQSANDADRNDTKSEKLKQHKSRSFSTKTNYLQP